MINLTTQEQRDALQEVIQTELLKRGFTAPIKKFEEVKSWRGSSNRIEFKTENFQTTPVIFQGITVDNFNSTLEVIEETEQKRKRTKFWITVHVSYKHFDGGTNGCRIFEIMGDFYGSDNRPNYQIK